MTENELKRIIELFGNNVFQTAFCYMKSYADADDVREEAFIKLYLCDKSFDSDEHIKAWLLRVAVNLCKDRLRSFWYKKILPLETAMDIGTEEKQRDSFITYLFMLKSDYRIALYMHYYEGYTAKEIAKITGSKENTVLSHLSRGRKQLKDILLKEGYDESE